MTVPGVTKQRLQRVHRLIASHPYIPVVPTIRQLEFLAAPQGEKGYGGAAGGGKSIALLASLLLPVVEPKYAGLILRRTFPDLAQPEAIMSVAKEWLAPTDARWNERDKVFYFPRTGAKLQFGFIQREDHKFRYQSAAFQKVGYDEATQFPWSQYSYLHTRVRRTTANRVPTSIEAATNPGGVGHQWFYRWFVKSTSPERVFVSAKIADNPHLRAAEYRKKFRKLRPTERKQLEEGLWVLDDEGNPFKASFWDDKNRYVPGLTRIDVEARWIFVDSALKDKKDSAYNVAVVLELLKDYRIRVRHVWREKCQFPELVRQVTDLTHEYNYDNRLRGVIVEDKASGPTMYQTVKKSGDPLLKEFINVWWMPGSKEEKWHQASLWCSLDCVEIPHPTMYGDTADWLFPFEEELYAVPTTEYKDQADAFTLGILYLEHLIARGLRAREAVGA